MPPKKTNKEDDDLSIKLKIEHKLYEKLDTIIKRFEERVNEYDVETKKKMCDRIIELRNERDKVKIYLNKIDDVLDDLYELFKMANFYD